MRQKATRSKASGAIVEYMVAIARAWPRHAEQSTFTLLVVAVTLPWQFTLKVRSSGCADGRARTHRRIFYSAAEGAYLRAIASAIRMPSMAADMIPPA